MYIVYCIHRFRFHYEATRCLRRSSSRSSWSHSAIRIPTYRKSHSVIQVQACYMCTSRRFYDSELYDRNVLFRGSTFYFAIFIFDTFSGNDLTVQLCFLNSFPRTYKDKSEKTNNKCGRLFRRIPILYGGDGIVGWSFLLESVYHTRKPNP